MNIDHPTKTLQFDPDKCTELYKELVEIFKKYRPTVGEILIAYGNLGYSLGASIGSYKEKGPGIDELKQLYYSEPGRLDVAMMLQGMMVTEWYEEWAQKQVKQSKDNGET